MQVLGESFSYPEAHVHSKPPPVFLHKEMSGGQVFWTLSHSLKSVGNNDINNDINNDNNNKLIYTGNNTEPL